VKNRNTSKRGSRGESEREPDSSFFFEKYRQLPVVRA